MRSCAHIHVREKERYCVVHRYIVVCVEVGVKAHQSHPPQNQGKYPHWMKGDILSHLFVNGLPSLCYKRRARPPLWGLPILSVRGIPLRSRVRFRVLVYLYLHLCRLGFLVVVWCGLRGHHFCNRSFGVNISCWSSCLLIPLVRSSVLFILLLLELSFHSKSYSFSSSP